MLRPLKFISIQLIGACLLFSTVTAQEETDQENMYYVADYNIKWESIFEWNKIYREHSVPILQSLEDEGVISGWSAWMHNTGGQYNWRLVVASSTWDNYDEFWDEYLSRFPEEEMEKTGHIVTAHRDQVWNADIIKYADNADSTQYIYEALYQVNFGNMEQWNKTMNEKEVPLWDKALEDNMISGYVVLGHNTGDRYNHGRVYLFNEWDKMDDFQSYVMGNILSDEELWNQMGSKIIDHTDTIWERVHKQTEDSN